MPKSRSKFNCLQLEKRDSNTYAFSCKICLFHFVKVKSSYFYAMTSCASYKPDNYSARFSLDQ